MIKELLTIPQHYYQRLLASCAVLWPEYRTLKNGIVVHDSAGREHVQILCNPAQTQLIINFAQRTCAEAIPHIRRDSF